MVRLTEKELGIIAKTRGIKGYKIMSREMLLSNIDKYDRIIENLSENMLNKIEKMQNLSLNKLEQIEKMNNFSENKLERMAKIRNIKKYKDMLREDFLIALLKSNSSHTKLRKSEDNNTEIGETKRLFNEFRNNCSKEEIEKTRKKSDFLKATDEYLKELEKKDSLTKQEKKYIKLVIPRNYRRQKNI